MTRIFKPSILALLLVLLLSFTVSGQQNDAGAQESVSETPIEIALDGAEGTLGINQEVTVMAEAELTIGGQIYKISVPAKVVIDTEQILAEAGAIVNVDHQIGAFAWNVIGMEETSSYESGYTEVEASSDDNKLVVVTFDMTNMADSTLSIWDAEVDVFAVDDLGKTYESSKEICDDIDPGETLSCTWVFDVPADVNMVDTSISAMQTKQLSLSTAATE